MNSFFKLLLGAASIAVIAGCGGGDDSLDDRLSLADPKVRFVNAVPLSPNVTLFRNDAAQADATSVGYKFASKYFDVETGPANWTVKTTTGNVTLGTVPIDAKRGRKYTLVALPGSTVTEVVLIDDPYNKGVTADFARVRVLNASFNAQNVDVYLTAPAADLTTAVPNVAAVGYKQAAPASGGDSLELGGGVYQLRITTAGTKTVIFNAPVTLAKNADWLVLTIPDSGAPNSIKVLVAQSDVGTNTTLEIASQ